ncbi:MAG: protein kinase [Planctomycetes bacterium]|nr:protein kinase [Planctomycetota bacterium]
MATIRIEPGFRLGKYEVMEHLATGGMGAVYKAVDRELGRLAALKVLHTHLTENGVALERFRREARNAARLNHPNIVTLYGCSWERDLDVFCLAFEFVDGVDLGKYIQKRGKLKPEEARRITIHVAEALGHAFEHGIVHRDVKPSNIMLARSGRRAVAKLADMGLAVRIGEDEFRLTREGSTVGTIDYMAPEQARDSHAIDIRTDIYSLGCTMYHMLAGEAPFAQGGLGERLFQHLETPPTDVRQFNPAVSTGFWAIMERMLAKNPDNRYRDPRELLRALKRTRAEASGATPIPVNSSQRKTRHAGLESTRLTVPAQPLVAAAKPAPAAAISTDQVRAAASLQRHALEILSRGSDDYARQLLEDALRLNPFDLIARKTLRDLHQKKAGGVLGRWFASLNVLAIKSKMHAARTAGDWRKVFEYGEQVLVHQPTDADTHIEMAETATDIGLPALGRWFLEQGSEAAPDNATLVRARARLHEHLQDWKPAIALWERVVELEPSNFEAQRKITDLSAQDMLASGHYS